MRSGRKWKKTGDLTCLPYVVCSGSHLAIEGSLTDVELLAILKVGFANLIEMASHIRRRVT